MNNKDIRVEVMSNILEEHNIILTKEQIESIVDDFSYHLDMEQEMESYSHISSYNEKCSDCEEMKLKIKRLENIINETKPYKPKLNYFGFMGDRN